MLKLADSETGVCVTNDVILDVTSAGTGPTLLLLHGAEGSQADSRLISELSKNFTVIAPSHPGFGLSPRPDWCDSIDDLAYVYLDWMEQQGFDEVVLVGLQFGGWLAAEMAVRDSSRFSRVILVDAVGIKVGGREDRDIADVFAMSRQELDSRLFADPLNGPGDLTVADADAVLHIARNEEALALFAWEPYLHNPRLRRWLHRVSAPTLVIWGDKDGIVSPEYGEAYAASIPNARFELVRDAAHRCQIDQPTAVASLISNFTR